MKPIVVFIMFLFAVSTSYSQTVYGKVNDKWITTAADTTVLTGLNFVTYEVSLSNRSATDTLQYRFDSQKGSAADTTWANLFPTQTVHFNNVFAKKFFRRAVSDSVYSQFIAN